MAQAAQAETPTETEEPRPILEQEVTFDSGGVTLSATLWERERVPIAPPAEGKKPKKIKEGDPEAPPRAFCVLVHGLLSDRNEFGALGKRLAQSGLGAIAIDLKGHGRSGGARGIISVESIVEDIEATKTFLASREEQWDLKPQQWCVIGHSLGALGAMKAGYDLNQESEIVAIAPPRTIREEIGPLKRLGYAFAYRSMAAGAKASNNGDDQDPGRTVPYQVTYADIIENKAAREKAKKAGFLQTRIPLRNYPALMAADGEVIARNLLNPNVTVIMGTRDRVVANSATRAVYEALPTSKRLWSIDGSGHSVFMDARAEHVMDRLIAYIVPRLSEFPEVRDGHTKR